jgi:hypothetical protein
MKVGAKKLTYILIHMSPRSITCQTHMTIPCIPTNPPLHLQILEHAYRLQQKRTHAERVIEKERNSELTKERVIITAIVVRESKKLYYESNQV